MIYDYIIPVVGSKGSLTLRAPFNTESAGGIQFTCRAVRQLSDYIAANEDVKDLIYDKYDLSEAEYQDHLAKDIHIASFQSEQGHWLYVPANYIEENPSVNGIPYRSFSLVVKLPALHAETDFSTLKQDLKDQVLAALGVNSVVVEVATSKITQIDATVHRQKSQERAALIQGNHSKTARIAQQNAIIDAQTQKIAELEAYILSNLPTP